MSLRLKSAFAALVGILVGCAPAAAGNATLIWNAPTQDVSGAPLAGPTALTGYNLYERCGANPYSTVPLPASQTQVTRTELPDGTTCYWQISALNSEESDRSNEVFKSFTGPLPGAPQDLLVTWDESPAAPPSATLTITPTSLPAGGGIVLVEYSCLAGVATLSGLGQTLPTGKQSGQLSGPLTQSATITVTCSGGGTASQAVMVGP